MGKRQEDNRSARIKDAGMLHTFIDFKSKYRISSGYIRPCASSPYSRPC